MVALRGTLTPARGHLAPWILAAVLGMLLTAAPAGAKVSVGDHLLHTIRAKGVDEAIELYHVLRRTDRDFFDFGENQLNLLGYQLLREKRYDDAIAILKLNIEMFPQSANAHDSLAEAYMRYGKTDQARREYQRAMSMLDRQNGPNGAFDEFLRQNIRVQLARIRAYPIYEPLVGVYETKDGKRYSVSIAEPSHGNVPPQLRLVDLGSGSVRTLHEKSGSSYWTGPGLELRSPVETRVKFSPAQEGMPASMELTRGGAKTRATRLDLRLEPVQFDSRGFELEGTLALPGGEGPHPAVVLVHGSGNATRNMPGFGELADFFVLRGYAVLRYDKRGWGDSAGETASPVLRELAGDAIRAFRLLASRGDIDPRRIGIVGFSEGAWVAGMAAARLPANPYFVILISGGGVEPWRQDMYRVGAEMRANGESESSIEEALEFVQKKIDVARTGAGWDEFLSAMRSASRTGWYKYVLGWPSLNFARRAWDEVLRYEPESALVRINSPVLALLAANDVMTPEAGTRAALERAFDGPRSSLLCVVTVGNANHMHLESGNGSVRFSRELASVTRYGPGYFDVLADWLSNRAAATTDAGRPES